MVDLVNAIAYRTEYLQVRGQLKEASDAAGEKIASARPVVERPLDILISDVRCSVLMLGRMRFRSCSDFGERSLSRLRLV